MSVGMVAQSEDSAHKCNQHISFEIHLRHCDKQADVEILVLCFFSIFRFPHKAHGKINV